MNCSPSAAQSGWRGTAYTRMGQLNNFVKSIDGNNYSQYFTYDLAGRVTRMTYPDGSYADYAYTNGGNLSTVSLNGMVFATWSNYNPSGNPQNVAYGNGVSTAYGYDVVNRLTSLVTTKGSTTLQNLAYGFDAGGINITSITDNRSNKIDANNINTDETQTYTYDALYRLTGAAGVWGTKTYAYDSIGNVTTFGGLVNRTLAYTGQQVTSGTGLTNVTYDASGNMTHKVLDGVTWDYAWTAENRLASAQQNGATTAQLSYDADGNRVKKVYTAPGSKKATTTTTYIGKMYEKRVYSDGTQRHTINVYGNGQLVATYTRAGTIPTAMAPLPLHRQEALAASMYGGRSIQGGANKAFHWLGAVLMHPWAGRSLYATFAVSVIGFFATSLLRRLPGSGRRSLPRPRVGLGLRLASVFVVLVFTLSACSGSGRNGMDSSYLLTGDTLSGPAIGTYFYHRNHANSSSVITDASGNETTRIVYLPFGEISQANSSGGDTVTAKFTGQEYDEETGLYYFGARYYDPAIGRFVSADSVIPNMADAQAWHHYSYVKNNPIMYIDPTGHFFLWDWLGAVWNFIAGVVSAVAGAIGSAATWLFNAAVDVVKFGVRAVTFAWQMIRSMVRNPLAIAGFLLAVVLSIATLNPGPLLVWAETTGAAIAATSVAMAAGVTNPTVLAFIAAAAAALGGGAGLVQVFKSVGQLGLREAAEAIGGSELAAGLGLLMAVGDIAVNTQSDAPTDEAGDEAAPSDTDVSSGSDQGQPRVLLADASSPGESSGTATDAQIDYSVARTDPSCPPGQVLGTPDVTNGMRLTVSVSTMLGVGGFTIGLASLLIAAFVPPLAVFGIILGEIGMVAGAWGTYQSVRAADAMGKPICVTPSQ